MQKNIFLWQLVYSNCPQVRPHIFLMLSFGFITMVPLHLSATRTLKLSVFFESRSASCSFLCRFGVSSSQVLWMCATFCIMYSVTSSGLSLNVTYLLAINCSLGIFPGVIAKVKSHTILVLHLCGLGWYPLPFVTGILNVALIFNPSNNIKEMSDTLKDDSYKRSAIVPTAY